MFALQISEAKVLVLFYLTNRWPLQTLAQGEGGVAGVVSRVSMLTLFTALREEVCFLAPAVTCTLGLCDPLVPPCPWVKTVAINKKDESHLKSYRAPPQPSEIALPRTGDW